MAAPNASLVRWVELAVVLAALLPFVSGQCYLMDSTAECAICWVTRNFGSDLATTKISECPTGINLTWTEPRLEANITSHQPYEVGYAFSLDMGKFPPIKKAAARRDDEESDQTIRRAKEGVATKKDIPSALIRSCIASRGACTPFVTDAPGLSVHSAPLASDLDTSGIATFASDVDLVEGQWVIIAHVRFYTMSHEASGEEVQYDVAIGLTRQVMDRPPAVSPDTYISTAVLGMVLVLSISAVAWAARSGKLDLDRIIEVLYKEEVTIIADIICNIGDVSAYTVSVMTVIIPDNHLIDILPHSLMFLVIAWVGSIYTAYTATIQLYAIYQQHVSRDKWRAKFSKQIARASVHRIQEKGSKSRKGSLVEQQSGGSAFTAVHLHQQFALGRAGTVRTNFAKHINEASSDNVEKLTSMLEVEVSYREIKRLRGSVVTIMTESVPITAIQSYILLTATGEVQLITVLTLIAATFVMGNKLSGLGEYKMARLRRDAAEADFFERFCSSGFKHRPGQLKGKASQAKMLESASNHVHHVHDDDDVEAGNLYKAENAKKTALSGSPSSKGKSKVAWA